MNEKILQLAHQTLTLADQNDLGAAEQLLKPQMATGIGAEACARAVLRANAGIDYYQRAHKIMAQADSTYVESEAIRGLYEPCGIPRVLWASTNCHKHATNFRTQSS